MSFCQFGRGFPTFLVICALALLGSGCSIRHDFQYEPYILDGAKSTALRIAIMPFSDERQSINTGSKNLAYIPLVPTSAETVDAPQDKLDRKRGTYYYPDLVAYGIALDLRQNQLGSVVHFNPEFHEDYDVIIDGAITSMAKTDRNLTYGLSVAAFALHMFGAPKGSKSIDFISRYRVRTAKGEVLYEKQFEDSWTTVQENKPLMEGINQTIRENNTAFLEDVAPILHARHLPGLEAKRSSALYLTLDPELKQIDAMRTKLLTQNRGNSPGFKRLISEMERRERLLEKYKLGERKLVERQQEQFFELQEKHMAAINSIRQQKRAIEGKQRAMEEAADRAANQAIAGALVAGLMPATQQASAVGHWQGEHTVMALQDTANAMSALSQMPEAPPPPDLSHLVSALDSSNFDGLGSAGDNPFREMEGGSIADIRRQFLRWYRQRVTPLSSIY